MPRVRRVRARGFTLVELVVTLAVAASLLVMAAPSYQNLIGSSRLSGEYNRLAGDLRLARLEAIKRGGSVTVCARGGANLCGADWGAGWHVFTEKSAADGGVTGRVDDGETVLRSHAATGEARLGIVAHAIIRPAALARHEYIAFDSRGRPDWTLGTVVLCDERGVDKAIAMIVNGAGGVRRAQSATGEPGPVLDAFGTAVECTA